MNRLENDANQDRRTTPGMEVHELGCLHFLSPSSEQNAELLRKAYQAFITLVRCRGGVECARATLGASLGPGLGYKASPRGPRPEAETVSRHGSTNALSCRIPQPQIGSFRSHDNGTITLTNRPLICSIENDGTPRTIQRNNKGVWFWRSIISTNLIYPLFTDHICPRLSSRLLFPEEELLSKFWSGNAAKVVENKVEDYNKYKVELKRVFST
ncbi:Uncharacterized protein TPAR_05262 [Tolypocladium paradoxum]|uniref:Uncharacterized protein n=1 Tax=Tolypocladium paradoxum TaxID=94208 RepID=A0A2S4KWD6_9HYPO|nr:Uncharacterized protein TPAR_05262 [Tolypocladium paradoxum]